MKRRREIAVVHPNIVLGLCEYAPDITDEDSFSYLLGMEGTSVAQNEQLNLEEKNIEKRTEKRIEKRTEKDIEINIEKNIENRNRKRIEKEKLIESEEMSSEDQQEQMITKVLPSSKYVSIRHNKSLRSLQETYRLFYGAWLPNSQVQLANQDTIEVYDLKQDEMEIWIPIR